MQVVLFTAHEAVDRHVEEADRGFVNLVTIAGMVVEKAAKDGIAVETRKAAPDHPGPAIDEGAEGTVPNHAEIKIAHGGSPPIAGFTWPGRP